VTYAFDWQQQRWQQDLFDDIENEIKIKTHSYWQKDK
jgi:hypothetical protein